LGKRGLSDGLSRLQAAFIEPVTPRESGGFFLFQLGFMQPGSSIKKATLDLPPNPPSHTRASMGPKATLHDRSQQRRFGDGGGLRDLGVLRALL